MNESDRDITSDKVPEGKYVKGESIQSESKDTDDARENPVERTFKIETSESTSRSSYSFKIDVEEEKELRLFREVNKLIKELKR